MPDVIPADSVGIVTPQIARFETPLALCCGQTLSSYQLTYETYGTLNQNASNAILICHALSGEYQTRLVGFCYWPRQSHRYHTFFCGRS
jgi:homoserine O-acetyltransferase